MKPNFLLLRLFFMGVIFLSMPVFAKSTANQIEQALNEYYGKMSPEHHCWMVKKEDSGNVANYCVKVNKIIQKKIGNANYFYILTTGDVYPQSDESHGTPGFVGVFLLKEQNDQLHAIATAPKLSYGDSGEAPHTQFELVQIGDDYFAWIFQDVGSNQGYTQGYYAILAPHKNRFVEIAMDLPALYDNAGVVPDIEKQKNDLKYTLTVVPNDSKTDLYPLKVKVTGIFADKSYETECLINFSKEKWGYFPCEKLKKLPPLIDKY